MVVKSNVLGSCDKEDSRRILLMGGEPHHWERTRKHLLDGSARVEFLCKPGGGGSPGLNDLMGCEVVVVDHERVTPSQREFLHSLKQRMPSLTVLLCVEAQSAGSVLQSFGRCVDDCLVKWEGYEDALRQRIDWLMARTAGQQKRMQEATFMFREAQRLEALGILAGGFAHDLNNVLSAVLGYTQMTLMGLPQESSLRDQLHLVLKAGSRAKELVSMLSSMSSPTKGEIRSAQLGAVVKEAIKYLKASLPSSIEILQDLKLQPSGWDAVSCDPIHLSQIVLNLFTNAVNALDPGGYGKVTIELFPKEVTPGEGGPVEGLVPGRYAMLRVSHNGSGIPRPLMDKIFEPCFATREDGRPGLGLGLSIARELVKSSGGSISAESPGSEGTTLTVALPCAEASPTFESSDDGGKIVMGHGRVLLVDDEEMLVQVGTLMLNKLGYDVTGFTDSQEALEHFQAAPEAFDMVITDLTMPRMTGFDLARKLLATRPDVPIIVCTGYGDGVALERLREIGVTKILRKPFIMKLLSETIRGVLRAGSTAELHSGSAVPERADARQS